MKRSTTNTEQHETEVYEEWKLCGRKRYYPVVGYTWQQVYLRLSRPLPINKSLDTFIPDSLSY